MSYENRRQPVLKWQMERWVTELARYMDEKLSLLEVQHQADAIFKLEFLEYIA